MPVNRSVKKFVALVLAAAAVVAVLAVTQVGGHSVAAGAGNRGAASIAHNQGNPDAVPPILRPATRSELAEMAEAREGREFYYELPASARYSGAVFSVFAKQGRGGS